jgi:hypothetical protein
MWTLGRHVCAAIFIVLAHDDVDIGTADELWSSFFFLGLVVMILETR